MGLNAYFAHPMWLTALLVPLVAAIIYVWLTRRRRERALQFGNFTIIGQTSGGGASWLRHIPVAGAIIALSAMVLALAGPLGDTKVARHRATVMLVVDVSYSMSAKDVAPDRITAAKEAGREFIDSLPDNLNVGLVTFSGRAQTPITPTTNHDAVSRALQGAELDAATATGDGIAAALSAIKQFSESLEGSPEGAPPGTIVLLSDGKQTIPDKLDDPRGAYTAADESMKIGIPINTISFGTSDGYIVADGETIPVPNDDQSLVEIARRTEGEFFTASSLEQLRDVYSQLRDDIGYEIKRAENPRPWLISAFFALVIATAVRIWNMRQIPSE